MGKNKKKRLLTLFFLCARIDKGLKAMNVSVDTYFPLERRIHGLKGSSGSDKY